MIDRKPPGIPILGSRRERRTFRDVSFEAVNLSNTQTVRYVDYYGRLDRPTIEIGPGESALIPDRWWRIFTSDGLPAKIRENYGNAKSKRARRRLN